MSKSRHDCAPCSLSAIVSSALGTRSCLLRSGVVCAGHSISGCEYPTPRGSTRIRSRFPKEELPQSAQPLSMAEAPGPPTRYTTGSDCRFTPVALRSENATLIVRLCGFDRFSGTMRYPHSHSGSDNPASWKDEQSVFSMDDADLPAALTGCRLFPTNRPVRTMITAIIRIDLFFIFLRQ